MKAHFILQANGEYHAAVCAMFPAHDGFSETRNAHGSARATVSNVAGGRCLWAILCPGAKAELLLGWRGESTKSCNCCGKPFWLHSRKGAACVSTSTVPPAKRTKANSVQRKAACLLPVISVKQIPSLLCLDFSRLSLCSAEREPLATSLCCFRILVIAKPSPYLVCWSMCSGRGLGAGPCPAVGCREAWGGQGQHISPGSVEEPHLSKESLCSQQTPRRVAALLPGTAAVRPVGSGGLGCRGRFC